MAKVGDNIKWVFDKNSNWSKYGGKTFRAKIAHISEDGDFYVYASYGVDLIPVDRAKVLKVRTIKKQDLEFVQE